MREVSNLNRIQMRRRSLSKGFIKALRRQIEGDVDSRAKSVDELLNIFRDSSKKFSQLSTFCKFLINKIYLIFR